MKKKAIILLLIVCFCIGCTAYAEEVPAIKVDSVTANQGEEVTIAVTVKDNPGFAAMMFELTYDSEKLTPLSVAGGTVTNNATIVSNIQQGGDTKQYNPITFFVVNPSNFVGDGEVFLVTFRIDENAEPGSTELILSYEDEAIANQEYEDVNFNINQGSILIETTLKEVNEEPKLSEQTAKEPDSIIENVDNTTQDIVQENVIEKETPKKEITITIDGKDIKFDQPPIIVNDRTLVPMRAIFEALGAVVEWENETRTAVGTKDGITIRIQIDNNVMKKNNSDIVLDVPAQLVNDRTLVPIRAVSESFGCKVEWVNSTKTVVIITK